MHTGVLRTRLLPPRLPAACLPRPELVERILKGAEGRLVSVVAGAGWGKSTLLVQALAATSLPWVWLSCDERIGGAKPFLAHLAAGFAERFPGVGQALELEGSVEDQVAELCNEVAVTVADDFLIVLDDIHTLERRPAAEALALLVQDLPPTAHLLVAGRQALRLPLGRYRMAWIQIGEEALAFSEEESAKLLRTACIALSPKAAADLYRLTEGWPAGLILAAQSGEAVAEAGRRELGGTSFDYLAEEVFARQSRDTQDFLLDTAVLDRFTPELAAAVTGWPDASETIAALCSAHLFTIRLGGDWYRYHHLFHDFLRRRLSGRKASRIAELHRRAAAAWVAAGEPAEAVAHYLAAGEPGLAVEALEPIAEAMVASPAAELLAQWLASIPEQYWSTRPGLVLAQASLAFARGEHESSYQRMERALEVLLDAGEHDRAAVAFFRLIQNMVASGTGSPRRVAAGRRYVPRLDPSTRLLPLARVMLAVVYGYSCQLEEAEEELKVAVSLPQAAEVPIVEIYADAVRRWYVDYPRGRLEEALASLTQAVSRLERCEPDDVVGFLPSAHLYRAIVLIDLARGEEVLSEVDRFQQAADRRGMGRAFGRLATWIRLAALAGLHRFDELEAEMVAPGEVAPPGESSNFAYRYAVPAALLAAHRRDADRVAALAATSRREMAEHGPAIDQPLVLCDLAGAALDVGLPELARDLARQAGTMASSYGMLWWEARAALLGSVAWGPGREGDTLLAQALDLTGRFGLVALWTTRERTRVATLLARALTGGLGAPRQVAQLAVACGSEAVSAVASALRTAPPEARSAVAEAAGESALPDALLVQTLLSDTDEAVRQAAARAQTRLEATPRPPVHIVSLGGFYVWRGGLPVPELSTGRQKARTLLAILLSADGALHREMLLEYLWADLPPERGLAALHSALYTLRRLLEPTARRQSPPTLVVTDGEAYRLSLSERDEWDAATFSRLAQTAAKRTSLDTRLDGLLAAEATWGGSYLPEWPYEDWAAGRRAELNRAYEGVLEALAEALAEAGEHRAALARWQRLAELDPERESWQRSLMTAYARAGERALALRQYQACRTLLRERLGVEPSPETTNLYTALL